MELLKQGEKERLPLLSEAQMAEELAERKGRRFGAGGRKRTANLR